MDTTEALPPGRTTPWQPRARRLRVALPALVLWPSGAAEMTVHSLSEGGCGLAWLGLPPRLGAPLGVQLGDGPAAVALRARVCWVRDDGRGLRVGAQFAGPGGTPDDLAALLARLEREAEAG